MRIHTITALVALHLAIAFSLPQNNAQTLAVEESQSNVATVKGDMTILDTMADGSYVRVCTSTECKMVTVSSAKGREDLTSLQAPKGDAEISDLLAPTFATMDESMKGINAQQAMLENLQREMAALSSAFGKGEQLSEQTKASYASTMTKGLVFSPQPPAKGTSYASPPSKGSGAATMQLEAAMCPMTMYELGKSQKLYAETKQQLDSAMTQNAIKSSQKMQLENALAASNAMKQRAEEQAAFNAKYAAEQKSQAEALARALAQANAEKAALQQQKAQLESDLLNTQVALAQERQTNMALSDALKSCEEDKAQLQVEKEALQEALNVEVSLKVECQQNLAQTSLKLESTEKELTDEKEAHAETQSNLEETESDLAECQSVLAVTVENLQQTTIQLTNTLQELTVTKATLEITATNLANTQEELASTQAVLRDTQRALEDEQNAHAQTQRELEATQQELEATEQARRQLEEAKQQLEDELAETKTQLDNVSAERDQLQIALDATSAALEQCTAEKMQCEGSLAEEKALTEQLTQQLEDAMVMLAAEKEAREQLTETIMLVKAASEKVQEEVRRLQLENVQLQQQVQKLRSEQEAAVALAAGCPPTYEKFGLSCYKYVREKTQWKMAQEQCMKDSGNLVAVESRQEQAFLVDLLKRHGAESKDAYSLTSGYKAGTYWKWKGSYEQYMGATGPEYWYNELAKMKPGYDCQAMYLRDTPVYGKWMSLPCYNAAPFICEYNMAPPGTNAPSNSAETAHMMAAMAEAPSYLSGMGGYGTKGQMVFAPPTKGSSYGSKGASLPQMSSYKGFSYRRY